jgi:hypothetical protein
MMEAASTSETSVNFYQTALRNNPENSNLHTRRRENLRSHILLFCRGYKVIYIHYYFFNINSREIKIFFRFSNCFSRVSCNSTVSTVPAPAEEWQEEDRAIFCKSLLEWYTPVSIPTAFQ